MVGTNIFGLDDPSVYAVALDTSLLDDYEVWRFEQEHGDAEAFRALCRAVQGEENVYSPFVRVYTGRPTDMEWWQERRMEVFDRDGHTCTYCGSGEDLEVDHIEPLSRGGTHQMDNLTTACATCNRSKGDKLLGEWEGAN